MAKHSHKEKKVSFYCSVINFVTASSSLPIRGGSKRKQLLFWLHELSVWDPPQVPLNFGNVSKGNSLPRSSSDEDADDGSVCGFCATSFDQQ
jgi:hypothetical protein